MGLSETTEFNIDANPGQGIKVLLVFPNENLYMNIPAGISILSACLKAAGHRVKLFDATLYASVQDSGDEWRAKTLQVKKADMGELEKAIKKTDMFENFRKMVEEYQPDLIGVSVVEATLNMAFDLLSSIKEKKIPKIMGGIGVLFLRERIIQNDLINMLCIGEGEEAIVELADALRDGKDYSHIRNLWVKQDGIIIKNEQRELVDLDSLPFPDWSIFEKPRFYKPMGGILRVTASIEDSRGCHQQCTYCCSKGQRDFYKPYNWRYLRKKSVDRVISEIKAAVQNYGVDYVFFHSQNFFIDRYHDFDEFIEKYQEIGLPFWVQTEPGSFTAEKLEKFKKAGCEGLSIGVEHGNEKFRKEILKRNYSNEFLAKSLRIAEESGIRVTVNNIIGFPTETREQIFDTINFNRGFHKLNTVVNLFAPYVGTELRRLSEELGYIDKETLCGDFRKSYYLEQPHITTEELVGLQRTFVLYVKMPKSKWGLIERAEKLDDEGNRILQQLLDEFASNEGVFAD